MPFTRNFDMSDWAPTLTDKTTVITMPTVDYSGATTDEQRLHLFTQALQTWTPLEGNPTVVPNTAEMIRMIESILEAIGEAKENPLTLGHYDSLVEMESYLLHIKDGLQRGVGGLTESQLQQLWEYLQRLYGDAQTGINTQTHADIMTGTVTQSIPGIRTIAESMGYKKDAVPDTAINWGKVSTAWGGLASVFPFCIPFDIIGMFRSFQHDARPLPPIDINILPFLGGDVGRIQMDLIGADFEPLVRILRIFLFLAFCVGLAFATGKVIGW
jgi:hypothetical protein